MFHQTPEVHQWGPMRWLSTAGFLPPPRNWTNVPWKATIFQRKCMEMSSFSTSNFQENMLVSRGVPFVVLIFTLRIMGSQVTGGLEIQKTPAKNTSKPLFLGRVTRDSIVILRVTSSAYIFKLLQAKFYCTMHPYISWINSTVHIPAAWQ